MKKPARVQTETNGQVRQRMPKTALFVRMMVTVWPPGRVTVPAAVSMAKSSLVKPAGHDSPQGNGLDGLGVAPARRAARTSPEPSAESASASRPRASLASSATPLDPSPAFGRSEDGRGDQAGLGFHGMWAL